MSLKLHLYLARCGLASRRRCEEHILAGDVSVNGNVILSQGMRVEEGDRVSFRGRVVHMRKKHRYIALYKPSKYLCSSSDREGRPLALDLLKPALEGRLFTVGRLDFLSTGLLFVTDDGVFARCVSHPSLQVEKEYHVVANREIPTSLLRDFSRGIFLHGERFTLTSYQRKGPHSACLVLREGKYRELRRIFLSRDIGLKKVHRMRIGPVTLKGLAPGRFRHLTQREIHYFLRERRGGQKHDRSD